jgi:AAA+ superfamily predicted ATPase
MNVVTDSRIVPFVDSQAQLLAGLAMVDLRVRWAVVRARAGGLDPHDEFRGLYVSDEQIDQLLTCEIGQHLWLRSSGLSSNGATGNGHTISWPEQISQVRRQWQAQTRAGREQGVVMRLDDLAQAFALTLEEVEAFLLALAPELDPRYAQIYAYLQDDVTRKRPSIDLILNLLTDNFGQKLSLRRLLCDNGRLLQARLLERSGDDQPLLGQTVRPYAHVVEYLLGDNLLDARLDGLAQLLPTSDLPAPTRIPAALLARLTVANQFTFTPGQIADVAASARDLADWQGEKLAESHLLAASRAHSNQKLGTLATKIRPRYSWTDIVLPEDTLAQLREMVNTVHQRPTVYGEWGFERKIALGKGLNALFAGESGTGKTMSADIMAGVLGLDLYKIDLSSLVSKYIGETEKNLNRIFTEAATSNAILFFDEADAIFGKRSEVKDSHDRYANIEISYLLQRMEAYDGVVILATNMRSNLDDAFTRRLHFIIEFPFPEAADREIIWRVNFPPETPLAADINFPLLAERFRLAGGNIRNIIMAAAFLAAESDTAVGMSHLLHATRREYQKMGRLIDENLFVV